VSPNDQAVTITAIDTGTEIREHPGQPVSSDTDLLFVSETCSCMPAE
jgi:hypothetical protein